MFTNLSWDKLLVLLVAALFILGPDRLPEAAAWLGKAVRRVREFASTAQEQMRTELGSDYDELRKPLADLQRLRGLDPRRAVARHLFDDDPDPLGIRAAAADLTRPADDAPPPVQPSPPAVVRPAFDHDAT